MKQLLQGHSEVDPSEIQQLQYHNVDQWINSYKKVADKMKDSTGNYTSQQWQKQLLGFQMPYNKVYRV